MFPDACEWGYGDISGAGENNFSGDLDMVKISDNRRDDYFYDRYSADWFLLAHT